ncbi:MAG: diguanylate cyclase [Burkholderiales bacterium RIFCSPLOWO2_02_FULL_57_36]|nr:MAG: diguanylate cyclase [Burkholderiales bacterium RIFCSPLOWO2_02_FULL_57_36]
MSLYRQLWLAIVISTLLALGGSLVASLLSARGYLESQLSIKNTDNATALALSLSQGSPDAVMADLVVASLFDSGHYELIRITDPMGGLITERIAPAGDLDAPAWFVNALPVRAHPGVAQISSGWKQFGTVTLVSHSRFAYGALWKSAYEMVFALAVAGLIGGYLGSLVLRRLRGPLNAVIEQAKAIAQRRFVTIDEPSVPELRQLAVAMNATVGRLKSMFEEEAVRLETVRREANFDPLTGLTNRSHFMARLRQSLDSEDAVGGSLVLIRLADLVGVNRRLGRAATDDFLRLVGGALGECAAQSGLGVAARLNGADFAVLLSDAIDGRAAAEQLLQVLVVVAAPYVENGVVASMGVGRFKYGSDMGALLARVDIALASAEMAGANAVREAPQDDADEMPRTSDQWALMIRRALEHGWVRLISFPVVDADGKLSHRECPLRLMFDEKGEWLPAGRFLPIAERLKLTPALDLAAVGLGIKELQLHPQLPGLAINLSASSVGDAGFRKALVALLENQKSTTSRLWLEVAEAGALKHLDDFRELCSSLKTVGCRVGLEHYGHQFSQIGALHDLGLDYLKVDSSFVRGVESNAGNVAFLKGLCSIAHNIGLQVLAEGVATQAELDALIRLGFDGVTGPGVADTTAI